MSEHGIAGLLFDGRRSKGYPARLRRQGQCLLIEYGQGQTLTPPLARVRLGTRVGQADCYLHLPDGAAFETAHGQALAGLLQGVAGVRTGNWLSRLENSYRLIIASVLAVLLVVSAGMFHGVPWVAGQITRLVPQELEQMMGRRALAALESSWLEPSRLDAEHRQRVRQAFAPHLARFAEQHPGQVREVLFFSSPGLGANALALPGGLIIFTDELLQLAEHDDELVGVLAHEVGHVVHRHGLRNVIQGSMALWLIMVMTGDLAAASDLLVTVPALLVSLNYSRNMERAADDFALRYLPDAGVQPARLAQLMLRLEARSGANDGGRGRSAARLPEWLSSHPGTEQRMERFRSWKGAISPP